MAEEELTENDRRLYEYIKARDFERNRWSTPEAAKDLNLSEDEIYESLSRLAKLMKGKIYIYYDDGGIRIQHD